MDLPGPKGVLGLGEESAGLPRFTTASEVCQWDGFIIAKWPCRSGEGVG